MWLFGRRSTPHSEAKPSVTVGIGAGIEKSSVGLGLDSTDIAGSIVGEMTGIVGETTVVLTFSKHFVKRPSAVIVTNAYLDLASHGNYCVIGWDHSSFTISQMIESTSSLQNRPLYYYHVVENDD